MEREKATAGAVPAVLHWTVQAALLSPNREENDLKRPQMQDLGNVPQQVDRIAEIIQTGSPERKKELYNALFERIEERDGHISGMFPHTWARAFFNGDGCANSEV